MEADGPTHFKFGVIDQERMTEPGTVIRNKIRDAMIRKQSESSQAISRIEFLKKEVEKLKGGKSKLNELKLNIVGIKRKVEKGEETKELHVNLIGKSYVFSNDQTSDKNFIQDQIAIGL